MDFYSPFITLLTDHQHNIDYNSTLFSLYQYFFSKKYKNLIILNYLFDISKLSLPYSIHKFNLYKLTKKGNPKIRIAFLLTNDTISTFIFCLI